MSDITLDDVNSASDDKIEEAIMSALPSFIRLLKKNKGKIGHEMRSIMGVNKTKINYTVDFKFGMIVDIEDDTAINTAVTVDWPRKNGKDSENSIPVQLNVPVKEIKGMIPGFPDPAKVEEREEKTTTSTYDGGNEDPPPVG